MAVAVVVSAPVVGCSSGDEAVPVATSSSEPLSSELDNQITTPTEPVAVSPSTMADSTTSVTADPTTSATADTASGDPEMDDDETVTGGDVVRSYPGDTYPTELQSLLDAAIADLMERLGVDESSIVVHLVQEVTWGDASLGCPEPGRSYAQVVTDGLRMVLVVDGVEYDYRSGGASSPALCAPGLDKSEQQVKIDVTEDGEVTVVSVVPPRESLPTEGLNPPDD